MRETKGGEENEKGARRHKRGRFNSVVRFLSTKVNIIYLLTRKCSV